MLKGLLQNYGFELVMQFNEYHQRKRQREEEERRRREEQEQSKDTEMGTPNGGGGAEEKKLEEEEEGEGERQKGTEGVNGVPVNEPETAANDGAEALPEVKKSKCPVCAKEFSSIWVLKAHSEEIHKDVVPPEFLDKYVEELKSNLDKKKAESSPNSTPAKSPRLEPPKTPEGSPKTPRPEATSTPKSGKTTPSSQQHQKPPAAAAAGTQSPRDSKSPWDAPAAGSGAGGGSGLADMHSAFQQAILAAQQQSQNINPMMMHISQLQGMNPLVAMNLQPPLIPPALLSTGKSKQQEEQQQGQQQQPGTSKTDPVFSALLAQMQKSSPVDPQLQAEL